MVRSPGIVAHMIVGARPEPYLGAVLQSIASICDHAVINDNSGESYSANARVIEASALAGLGRVTLVRSKFRDFATARNLCIDATPARFARGWVLFVDADEVHGPELGAMAQWLPALPEEVDAVDGYSRHFVGSFRWWRTIERRLCFFRFSPERRWHGAVHEQLSAVSLRAIAPALWFHYGHVVPPRQEWEKSKLYASLGQPGWAPSEAQLASPTPQRVWGNLLREVLPYAGEHPEPVRTTIEMLSRRWHAVFARVDEIAARRTARDKMHAVLRAANWSRLLAWRAFEAQVRWRWRAVRIEPEAAACNLWPAQSMPQTQALSVAGGRSR